MAQTQQESKNQCMIKAAEETITELLHRTQILETRLNNPDLPEENRAQAEEDLKYIKSVLEKNKELLKKMKNEHRRPMLLISVLVFLCFFCYSMYVIFYGP
ncbi:uncharacterized protein LOC129800580 [Phlebotomus papatasi]|uniref:uncharacterized protein LOC129800580 n=1 Tax=Phlebotomus papatasi TaxID=29031 RepID=UPI002483E9CB|nr:uncharacterized protein LOC129800580 [Phlebotomus papatasi]